MALLGQGPRLQELWDTAGAGLGLLGAGPGRSGRDCGRLGAG